MICVLALVFFLLLRNSNEVLDASVEPIVFDTLNDGIYTGHYDGYRWSNTVEVTITDGSVTDIVIIEDVRFTDDVASALIINRVLQAEYLNIDDAVSGATITSIAYLKAIEDALNKAK